MALVYAVVSGKGGVGKTTTTMNVAVALSQGLQHVKRIFANEEPDEFLSIPRELPKRISKNGHKWLRDEVTEIQKPLKVVVVDVDQQGNSSKHIKTKASAVVYGVSPMSVAELFKGNCKASDLLMDTCLSNFQIISSNLGEMVDIEKDVSVRVANANFGKDRVMYMNLESLKDLDADVVLIDCPPSLGLVTRNALAVSDYAITPIKLDGYALEGYDNTINTIQEIQDNVNPNLVNLGCFFTVFEQTWVMNQMLPSIESKLKGQLLSTIIRKDNNVDGSTYVADPIVNLDFMSKASNDYAALAYELANLTGLNGGQ